jgi:hypothetical protein
MTPPDVPPNGGTSLIFPQCTIHFSQNYKTLLIYPNMGKGNFSVPE